MKTNISLSICLFITLTIGFSATINAANPLIIKSPDGSVNFKIEMNEGNMYYVINYNNTTIVEPSPMKMIVDEVFLSEGVKLGKAEFYNVNEKYPVRGFHKEAANHFNGAVIPVTHINSNKDYKLEIRVFNDGIGFRFVIPDEGHKRTPDEATAFTLPAGSIVWYHGFYWHYEGMYSKKEISDVKQGEWAAFPLTYKLSGDAGYVSISEAALVDYPGMSLQADGKNGFVSRLGHLTPNAYPFAHDYKMEDAIRLAVPASIEGTITTPWRTFTIGPDLNTIVNSDLISNLAPTHDLKIFPEGIDTDWIKPGRSVWTWMDGGERTLEGMKEFSRLAGQLGFEYNTVDAFWGRWTDEQLRELVAYSEEQGVKIWLWRHGRNVQNREERREFFKRCQDLGVVGVKLDAFSHESKEFIDLYENCLIDAAEFKLMVNFHGNNKPTGEVRTWPNEMTREGIRGLEYGRNQPEWSQHNTTLPFTRLLAGHGDYTPLIFGERRLETSWAHQIGTAIVFTSPLLIFAAHPQSIIDNPAVEIIKNIPSVWDETIVLPGSEIGEMAAFARRSGENWFLAILNGQDEKRFQVPLSFLGEGLYQATIARDQLRDPAAIKMEKAFARTTDTFPVQMRAGGGYIVQFIKN